MNPLHLTRSVIPMLAVCGAGITAWHFAVRPLGRDLAEVRGNLASARAEISQHDAAFGAREGSASDVLLAAQTAVLNVQKAAQNSADPTQIYECVGQIARRFGVRVERIEPRTASIKNKSDSPVAEVASYTISLIGPFVGVAEAIGALESETGLTRFQTVRISPTTVQGATDGVVATLETTHYRLTRIPGARDAAGGRLDVKTVAKSSAAVKGSGVAKPAEKSVNLPATKPDAKPDAKPAAKQDRSHP